jgi:hypothetical protein
MEELSVRRADVGGDVSDRVSPPGWLPANSRVVIFIHGYNTTKPNARTGYTTFADLLNRLGVPAQSTYGQLVAFYWPGDLNLGIFSGITYPTAMGPARESAQRLGDFVRRLHGPQGAPIQLFLICHSLGNRVGLEMIRYLIQSRANSWGRIEACCLMAAAVPVGMVQDPSKLGTAARVARTRVLYSKDDVVLHWAFPLGETAAADGFFPQAVGRFGNPAGLWTYSGDLQPYNHGHYWSGRGGDDRSARHAARMLGAAVPLDLSAAQPASRALPPERSTPTRRIGG